MPNTNAARKITVSKPIAKQTNAKPQGKPVARVIGKPAAKPVTVTKPATVQANAPARGTARERQRAKLVTDMLYPSLGAHASADTLDRFNAYTAALYLVSQAAGHAGRVTLGELVGAEKYADHRENPFWRGGDRGKNRLADGGAIERQGKPDSDGKPRGIWTGEPKTANRTFTFSAYGAKLAAELLSKRGAQCAALRDRMQAAIKAHLA